MPTFEERSASVLSRFADTLNTIRTGRAHPSILSGVFVDAYGAKTPLLQLANVTVADARMLVVETWDKSLIKEVEKAITEADLHVTPTVDGNVIRISFPEMTEENRLQMVKSLNTKLEDARVSIRKIREDEKKHIEAQGKSGDITEDDRYSMIEDLDAKTKKTVESLDQKAEAKEKEIMTI